MESTQYVIINSITGQVVFKGTVVKFGEEYKVPSWMNPLEYIKNWAAAAQCEIYEKV